LYLNNDSGARRLVNMDIRQLADPNNVRKWEAWNLQYLARFSMQVKVSTK
jgi:hypothetical protein